MVHAPYAYDKNPHPLAGRLRLWVGILLLIASLIAAVYMFWNLQVKPIEDSPADMPQPYP